MSLEPGSRLGPYEILSALGAGGMGEVYKAKDTRLDRVVAIKVLPPHLGERPELRQRFEREARAISSLSHPNICTLFDVGHQEGVDFLVMEHLEGESLAERLGKGPLPAQQVLRHGIEIADALEKAHRQGIVHRDLKPGNVMLTKSGVKLLDFGLARMAEAVPGGPVADALSSLPTEAAGGEPLTAEGTLLGTFQYMAPEQLEGKPADARTDLFAFGALLYEMATGTPAFQGKSRASLISAIMSSEPRPISAVQPLAPPALDQVVKTCLAKDPDDRWQTAHDVGLQLRWILEGGSQAGLPTAVSVRRRGRERIAWALFAAVALIAMALGTFVLTRPREEPRVVRFAIPPAPDMATMGSPRISPDGRFIAVNAADSAGAQTVWVRPLESPEFRSRPGTEGAGRVFWSPDSRFIGFFAQGRLKKVPVAGGPVQVVCDAQTGSDGTWGEGGDILFDGSLADPLRRVSASGGVASVAVAADSGNVGWPYFLPDGEHFLYTASTTRGALALGEIRVGKLGSGEVKRLGVRGSRPEYSPAGYLLYAREGTLLAHPFSTSRLEFTGEPIPVVESVGSGQLGDLAHFSVSRNHVLIYTPGEGTANRLVWMDRAGEVVERLGEPADMGNPQLSPSGDHIVTRLADPESGNLDLWILDRKRGTSTRLTFDASMETFPCWSPDGSYIAYSSDRNGYMDLFQKRSDGSTGAESLLVSRVDKLRPVFSPDGRYIAYLVLGSPGGVDIWMLPTFGDREPFPFLQTRFDEYRVSFSPDGRWLAYESDASGRPEVYVRPFPGSGGQWQVSTAGGTEPKWRADGRELFYITPDSRFMSVLVQTGDTFEAGVPVPLFQTSLEPMGLVRYDVSADGRRFLVVLPEERHLLPSTTVVLNWNVGVGER
jgi:Tol biopolymer transport system component